MEAIIVVNVCHWFSWFSQVKSYFFNPHVCLRRAVDAAQLTLSGCCMLLWPISSRLLSLILSTISGRLTPVEADVQLPKGGCTDAFCDGVPLNWTSDLKQGKIELEIAVMTEYCCTFLSRAILSSTRCLFFFFQPPTSLGLHAEGWWGFELAAWASIPFWLVFI